MRWVEEGGVAWPPKPPHMLHVQVGVRAAGCVRCLEPPALRSEVIVVLKEQRDPHPEDQTWLRCNRSDRPHDRGSRLRSLAQGRDQLLGAPRPCRWQHAEEIFPGSSGGPRVVGSTRSLVIEVTVVLHRRAPVPPDLVGEPSRFRAAVVPCRCGSVPLWFRAAVVPCRCGSVPLWFRAAVVPCRCGSVPL